MEQSAKQHAASRWKRRKVLLQIIASDASDGRKTKALNELVMKGHARISFPLIKLFPHLSEFLQEGVVFAMREVGSTRSTKWLLQLAEDQSNNSMLRSAAIEVLGDLRARGAKKALAEMTYSSDKDIRYWCVVTLGVLRARSATERLAELARSDNAVCEFGTIAEAATVALRDLRVAEIK